MNNIEKFMAGRSRVEFMAGVGVTRSAIGHWISGARKPNKWIMPQVLKWLGEPFGRVLDESEVWPE